MKRSYLNASSSLEDALKDLVRECCHYWGDIEDLRGRINHCLHQAAAIHTIDLAAVRRLVKVMIRSEGDAIDQARQEDIDAAYKAIVSGGVPVLPSRVDTEMDKVMALVVNDKPPKIDDIKKAIPCSQGKASKLRGYAAARLAAKSSSSRKKRENEHLEAAPVAAASLSPQEKLLQQAPDRDLTMTLPEPEAMNAPLDTSNVVSLSRSD